MQAWPAARAALTAFLLLSVLGAPQGLKAASRTPGVPVTATPPLADVTRLRPYSNDSVWNTPIEAGAPYDSRSAEMVATLGLDSDGQLATTVDGFSYTVYYADQTTPRWDVPCATENCTIVTAEGSITTSVLEAVPIPPEAKPAFGPDAGMVIIDRDTLMEYNLRGVERTRSGWAANNGGVYNLRWDGAPPQYGTRGAGVPYLAGLVQPWEIAQGHIDHVIAFAYPYPAQERCVYPASKTDGDSPLPFAIPEGARLQLDPSLTEDDFRAMGLGRAGQIIARALQEYGMILVNASGRPKLYVENLIDNPYATRHWSDPDLGLTNTSLAGLPYEYFRVLELPADYWAWSGGGARHGVCYAYGPASTTAGPPRLLPNVVQATVETEPVGAPGEMAGDLAIWVHPEVAAQSLVIGTDRSGGLAVYDIGGAQRQFLREGAFSSVDLLYDFPIAGEAVTLVAAGVEGERQLKFYRLEAASRALERVPSEPISIGVRVVAACLYHSRHSGQYFIFLTSKGGTVEQWELFDNGQGQVGGRLVRTLTLESSVTGCVADSELGDLYLAEAEVGIWKYGAEPGDGAWRRLVDRTGPAGHLIADVEGLALYQASGGRGYLIASSQGSSEFVVYERTIRNAFVAAFIVSQGDAIDSVSKADGIAVTNAALGPGFEQGLFVAQDGDNDEGYQNYKLIPWQFIAGAAAPPLRVDTQWDPRSGSYDTPLPLPPGPVCARRAPDKRDRFQPVCRPTW